MTAERLRFISDAFIPPLASVAIRLGLGPHAISLIAFACAVVAGASFYLAVTEALWYVLGAVLVGFNGILDVLDGAVARELDMASDAGDVLDHTLDRYADIILIGGLALGVEAPILGFLAVTGVLMTSYMGTQAQAVDFGRLYAGVMGRADRLVLIAVVAVVMVFFSGELYGFTLVGWLLVVFAIIGHLTALQRFIIVWRGLRG